MSVSERLTTILSTKGQVILPKAIREQRRWQAGTRLSVEDTPEGVLLKPFEPDSLLTVDDVFGILKRDGPALSLEEMDAGVMREAKRHARD